MWPDVYWWDVMTLKHFPHMITSSNGNIFRVTGPLCGEFTGHRWIPRTKASDANLGCFLWSAPWINVWVNNRESGDLRCQLAHCDVIVMITGQTQRWLLDFPHKYPVMRSFHISFCFPVQALKKTSSYRWFHTPHVALIWRHCKENFLRHLESKPIKIPCQITTKAQTHTIFALVKHLKSYFYSYIPNHTIAQCHIYIYIYIYVYMNGNEYIRIYKC